MRVHTRQLRLAPDVNIDALAEDCVRCGRKRFSFLASFQECTLPHLVSHVILSFVGADIAALCREAGLQAMREGADQISLNHFRVALRHVTPSGRRGVEVRAAGWQSRAPFR